MKLCHGLVWNSTSLLLNPALSRPGVVSCVSVGGSETERLKLAESLQSETLKILEWPSVCAQLAAFTSTSMGVAAAQSGNVRLGRSPRESRRLLDQTSAAAMISRPLDFSGIEDVTSIVDASVSGVMLSIGEICSVGRTLRSARSLVEQMEESSSLSNSYDRCLPLLEILRKCDFLMELEQKIEFCLDCNLSIVLDRASEDLEIIRSERKTNMENLESMLKMTAGQIFQAGGIDRPLVTKRRSRMCVAVRTTHKSLLPNGVVLDTSSSGATYFMEPREAVNLNNLEHPLLLESSLGEAMEKPDTTTTAFDFPVPVDFKIGNGVKVVVISGPNTGGKTASMKTLGLASIMLKAGMYLVAQKEPRLPWFDLVLADIGDHQSLEQSLSTFSGHISRICKILNVASERSLVLLDEIGSGTDPSEGVALSASILQYLKERINLAIVTTHYADLTRLKEKDARFENAAMEFSLETLQPTYRILWGSMGESNALSIAKIIGFDSTIIDRAHSWVKKLTPEKMQNLNSLLYQSLAEERNKLKDHADRAASVYSDVMKLYHEVQDEAVNLDAREAALMAQKSKQIQDELNAVKAEIDAAVQEFEKQLRITNPKEYNVLLKKTESAIASIVDAHQPSEGDSVSRIASSSYTPQIGEQVIVKSLRNKLATVVEAPSNDGMVLVQYGKVRLRVNMNSIDSPSHGTSVSRSTRQGQQVKRLKKLRNLGEATKMEEEVSFGPKVQTSKNTVDLRGMRAEQAILHLNIEIDSRASSSVLFIIHGMGTGVLKECVLELLTNHPRIAKFEEESLMNHGCTVAYIK
ncbi:uncharacterized protein LOC127247863 isoform X2 [Andrographis paniculata]|uniref:uncharacterized protein LOC127247863 isoform X2 n=1 Tax=Andrographis paniculata TaxID=175694 RepID=UPI0021E8265C|nr:uncharacterized protein LOC127247863 isoform X2 [Andrographis paniculata]